MPQVGQVTRWDSQADIWRQQYRFTQHLGGDRWEIEILPPDEQVIEAMFEYWASAELNPESAYFFSVYGEDREFIRKMTADEMLTEDLKRAEESAGRKMQIRVTSRDQYASYF